MSYVRWGPDSDVYVYPSARGIECCECQLSGPDDDDAVFDKPAEMIVHLDRHRAAGHAVPERPYERLRREAAR